jgi:hypothetical protein
LLINPVFIQAGKEANLVVFPMDHLRKYSKKYKITYGAENFDDTVFRGNNELLLRLPENFFYYSRYTPKTLKANTIYYSTFE